MHSSFTAMMIMVLTVQFFQPGIAFAGDGNDKTFSLKEAVQMATASNTLIKEAIENQKAAIEEEKSVKKEFLPKASASYSYSRLKDNPYAILGAAKINMGPEDNYHWDLTLSQPVFTGFALSTKHRMARLGIEIKGVEKEQAILDVSKQVKVAYFNILLAKKFLMVADEAVNQLGSHVKDAEKFYDHGMIPYNDLLKSKVALADAVQNRVKAESNVDMAISSFNTLLRMDMNRKTDVEDVPEAKPHSFEFNSLIEEAIENRPELRMLRLALKNSDYAIQLARSSYYPQVALVAGYEQNGDNPGATNNDYGNDHNAYITLQGKWTFFEWGKNRVDIQRFYHNKLSLKEKVEGIEDSIRLEVKSAFVNLEVARKNIQTAKESLTHAKENLRITNLQYQQQITTSTEVLDARTFLTQAETNYYSALYGYMMSMAELERAIGRR
ncbi:MAG: TolC family protein [Desulfobacterales bacterium]|nr:TolC family protein [Desulfobacterales bacterium]